MGNKNEELIKRTDVDGTPFTVITTPDGGSFVSLGKYRVSEPFATEKEAIKHVKSKDWNLLLAVIMLMVEDKVKEKVNTEYVAGIISNIKQTNNANN